MVLAERHLPSRQLDCLAQTDEIQERGQALFARANIGRFLIDLIEEKELSGAMIEHRKVEPHSPFSSLRDAGSVNRAEGTFSLRLSWDFSSDGKFKQIGIAVNVFTGTLYFIQGGDPSPLQKGRIKLVKKEEAIKRDDWQDKPEVIKDAINRAFGNPQTLEMPVFTGG